MKELFYTCVTVRNIAFLFALMFAGVAAMNYMPFIHAENGLIFGFFRLEPIANWLHVLSGIWAISAALYSRTACLLYFRIFGTAYFVDGVVGFLAGRAYLNLRIFDSAAEPVTDLMTRLVLDIPHLVIGGAAMFIGFWLYKRLRE